jgi:DNA-directed RNA polymerase specialized sigma24 family protein
MEAVLSEELCQQLILAARAGDEREIARVVGALFRDAQKYVLGLCRGKLATLAHKVGVTGDDVASHVLEKMLRRPPVGRHDRKPLESVLKWIRQVATNWLLDQNRRLERRPQLEQFDVETAKDPAPPVHVELDKSRHDIEVTAFLEACYPRALPLLELARKQSEGEADVGATDRELAAQLGTTPANVYKVRQRTRLYVGAFVAVQETPTISDRELSKALDSTENDEVRTIFAKVRQYLALHQKGIN